MKRKNFLLAGAVGSMLALTGCVSHYRDGGADLVGRDDLNALLNRSARMIDYAPDNDADCMAELLGLECIQDCAMPEGEEPDLKKTGIWDILNREI